VAEIDITDWTLAEIVAYQRGKLGLTQSACAKGVCGVRTLGGIESGRIKRPTARVRVALEQRLKLPPNSLVVSDHKQVSNNNLSS